VKHRRIALDRLPANLYNGFAQDRNDLRAACTALRIDPNDIWTAAYLDVERDDYWLRRRSDIARRTMDKLLKKLPAYMPAVQHEATTPPPVVAPAGHF
jgi:hypothetical protein